MPWNTLVRSSGTLIAISAFSPPMKVSERKQARDQYAHGIKPAEECDNDGGEAIARRYIGLSVLHWTRDLDDAGQSSQGAGDRECEECEPVGVETRKRAARGAIPTTRISNPLMVRLSSTVADITTTTDDRAEVETAALDQVGTVATGSNSAVVGKLNPWDRRTAYQIIEPKLAT